LIAWRNGEAEALDDLMPLVHRELKRIARNFMRRQRVGHTLQTTALVNEAVVRLVESDKLHWHDRSQYFEMSSTLMRRVLVDAARRRNSEKRGGERIQVSLAEDVRSVEPDGVDVVAIDEALQRLAALNQRQCQIVELRYFGGLTEDEIAETLNVSTRTVRRDWNVARAWLYRELN
jgi:RNA polymerase sigma factor (TIGR02999 family)